MTQESYRKRVSYLFEVDGEYFSINGDCDGEIEIEEVSNNGQEDSHRVGVIRKNSKGKWEWFECRSLFVTYGSKRQADEIIAYLNEHEPPKAD